MVWYWLEACRLFFPSFSFPLLFLIEEWGGYTAYIERGNYCSGFVRSRGMGVTFGIKGRATWPIMISSQHSKTDWNAVVSIYMQCITHNGLIGSRLAPASLAVALWKLAGLHNFMYSCINL